jgi:hypothetical protein
VNVEDVRRAVRAIRAEIDDDESAHADEDALHEAVLEAIANGSAEDPQAMAAEALETRKLEFARWCA